MFYLEKKWANFWSLYRIVFQSSDRFRRNVEIYKHHKVKKRTDISQFAKALYLERCTIHL